MWSNMWYMSFFDTWCSESIVRTNQDNKLKGIDQLTYSYRKPFQNLLIHTENKKLEVRKLRVNTDQFHPTKAGLSLE